MKKIIFFLILIMSIFSINNVSAFNTGSVLVSNFNNSTPTSTFTHCNNNSNKCYFIKYSGTNNSIYDSNGNLLKTTWGIVNIINYGNFTFFNYIDSAGGGNYYYRIFVINTDTNATYMSGNGFNSSFGHHGLNISILGNKLIFTRVVYYTSTIWDTFTFDITTNIFTTLVTSTSSTYSSTIGQSVPTFWSYNNLQNYIIGNNIYYFRSNEFYKSTLGSNTETKILTGITQNVKNFNYYKSNNGLYYISFSLINPVSSFYYNSYSYNGTTWISLPNKYILFEKQNTNTYIAVENIDYVNYMYTGSTAPVFAPIYNSLNNNYNLNYIGKDNSLYSSAGFTAGIDGGGGSSSSGSTSGSGSTGSTCVEYTPQTYTKVLQYDYSLFGKNINNYLTSGFTDNFSFRNTLSGETLQYSFGPFSDIYLYDSLGNRIFNTGSEVNSFFSGSMTLFNDTFTSNQLNIKIYSGSIDSMKIETTDDFNFNLYGYLPRSSIKTLIGNYKSNDLIDLPDHYYNLFFEFEGYKMSGYHINKILLKNYNKVYPNNQVVCYNSINKNFTIDNNVVDYSLIDNLPKQTIIDMIKGNQETIFKEKILDELGKEPLYIQNQYTLSSTGIVFDKLLTTCDQKLKDVNVGAFIGTLSSDIYFPNIFVSDFYTRFSSIFNPLSTSPPMPVFNLNPLSTIRCPIASFIYIYDDVNKKHLSH